MKCGRSSAQTVIKPGPLHSPKQMAGLEFQGAHKAMASIAPGLGLGAPLKDSHRLCDVVMEVPLAKDKWPCPFKNEI